MSASSFTETAAEMVAEWDAGTIVHTLEMGGMGPGYEQAIQVLVMELCRAWADKTEPDWEAMEPEDIERERRLVYDQHFQGEGYSGAQVGAATSLAIAYCRRGPRVCAGEVGDDRHTMVSRHFPKAPEPPQ